MADKVQLIKKEIERIIEEETPISKGSDYYHGAKESMEKLLKFIDSLPEEPVIPASEDLEEEMKNFFDKLAIKESLSEDVHISEFDLERTARHFVEWQKQQMMKNVVLETEVLMDCDGDGIETPYEEWLTLEDTEITHVPDGFKDGDIVKVILVKEDLP